jgi:hypothetical protein
MSNLNVQFLYNLRHIGRAYVQVSPICLELYKVVQKSFSKE